MSVDLVFDLSPLSSGNLVFGEGETGGATTATITGTFAPLTASVTLARSRQATITGTFAPLTASVHIAGLHTSNVVGMFAPLTVSMSAAYSSDTERPTVSQAVAPWQTAGATEVGSQVKHDNTVKAPEGWEAFWQRAVGSPALIEHPLPSALVSTPEIRSVPFQGGTPLRDGTIMPHEVAARTDLPVSSLFQDGIKVRDSTLFKHEDGDRTKRRSVKAKYQEARLLMVQRSSSAQSAAAMLRFLESRFQDGIPPPAGIHIYVPPVVPPKPGIVLSPDLLFSDLWMGVGDLLFIGENYTPPPGETVVVPVRRVYIVLNSVNLYRASDDEPIPVFTMSLSLDVDSWTWSFSATLPNVALGLVKPTNSEITELKAIVNGTEFRVLAESVSRSRVFGQASLNVSGRGYNATLDAPYAGLMSFGNTEQRTAQQLMADVLTLNNISLGWAINWELEDWIVPAGVFNHQGTYISALNAIAGAAGGFLLPHTSAKSFTVKHRYPVKPWEWGTATPDFQLPASVTSQEGIEWVDKARYNRVYVSGESVGVLGAITRQGTAGEILAQMVTDPLITAGAAARQRGTAILSDVGLQAHVTLRLPVLAETGILRPGHMIDYVDGTVTRRGIVRSTQVAVQGMANVWQSIGVETHDV